MVSPPPGTETISTVGRFEFRAKNIFLTYPQCDGLERGTVIRLLQDLGANKWVVSTERHSDGGTHIHALAGWDRPFRSRNCRCFDVGGHHPNISRVRSVSAVHRYVTKDGDFEGNWELESELPTFAKACRAADADQFMAIIEAERPRDYILYHDRLERFVAKKYKAAEEVYTSPHSEFDLPDDLAAWVENEFPKVWGVAQAPHLWLAPQVTRLRRMSYRYICPTFPRLSNPSDLICLIGVDRPT